MSEQASATPLPDGCWCTHAKDDHVIDDFYSEDEEPWCIECLDEFETNAHPILNSGPWAYQSDHLYGHLPEAAEDA